MTAVNDAPEVDIDLGFPAFEILPGQAPGHHGAALFIKQSTRPKRANT